MLNPILSLFREQYPELPQSLGGVPPAARALLLAALSREREGTLLCITASRAEADRLVDDLVAFGSPVALFPESDMAVFDQGESDPERLRALYRLEQNEPLVVIAPLLALLQPVPERGRVRRLLLRLEEKLDTEQLEKTLSQWGYEPSDLVSSPGQFARRGETFDLYPSNAKPVRLRVNSGLVTEIARFSSVTQRNRESLQEAVVLPMEEPEGKGSLLDYLEKDSAAVLIGPEEIKERLELMADATEEGWRYSAFRQAGILRDDLDDWTQIIELFASHKCYEIHRETADFDLEVEEIETFETLTDFKEWVDKTAPPIFSVTSQPERLKKALERRKFKNVEILKGRLSLGIRNAGAS